MITGIAHINLLVPNGTLDLAEAFYGDTLALTRVSVPEAVRGSTAWFDITPKGQQIHVAFGSNDIESPRHPCFRLESPEALLKLQQRIWDHHVRGDEAAPMSADKPGEQNSGATGVEFAQRFFARDYAGNRLEFSL